MPIGSVATLVCVGAVEVNNGIVGSPKQVVMNFPQSTNVAVLGATGSIGRATCDVLRHLGNSYRVIGLAANRSVDELLAQAHELKPDFVVVADRGAADQIDRHRLTGLSQLRVGDEALIELASHPEVDTVVAAIVGSAGLPSTLAAVQAGKRIALANKETMVVAGGLVSAIAERTNAEILPVDSEHSAIFQALKSGNHSEVKKLVLTASGGPFLRWPKERLAEATIEQACKHPNWAMGRKITIDSATMMNKALEVIEARWLFHIPAERIEVVVHPQSIVHSMVEFCDNSVIAQLSPPDMKLPIQYALTYPARLDSPAPSMDWSKIHQLQFEPVDRDRFPALDLGFEVAAAGGTTGVVLNAANEAAVELFLQGKVPLTDIATACRAVLDHHTFEPAPTLERLQQLDLWARQEVARWTLV